MTGHVRVLNASSRSDAAHARAAELVQQQRELVDRLDRFFREIAEVSELLKAEGSRWDGPIFDPPIEAAFGAWSAHGPRETRIDLDRVGPVPMMELEGDRIHPRSPDGWAD
jgi:hypothetical protein